MLDYPEYTLGIQARYGEAGTDGKIRLGALANWFQEAAGHNASALGFGDERLFAEGKAWILTRMAFRIKDLPSPGDKVNIRTWPAKLEHLGHRGYEVYNASDELIVAAVSAWTVLDLSTRRLTALPEELAAVYPVNTIPCIPFPSRTIPRLREGIGSSDVLVRRDDLDINGHVNNSKYSWLLECQPWSPAKASSRPARRDIPRRMLPGDALTSQCVPARRDRRHRA
ncbi:MAG: acyl-[acyl-carrier-protein] thioesterase [Bilophila wadsworthia]